MDFEEIIINQLRRRCFSVIQYIKGLYMNNKLLNRITSFNSIHFNYFKNRFSDTDKILPCVKIAVGNENTFLFN